MGRKAALSGGKNGRPFSTDIGVIEGQKSQPRFYLGTDEREAEARRNRLDELWQSVQTRGGEHWSETTLAIAHAIRRGETTYAVPMPPTWKDSDRHHARYYDLVKLYAQSYKGITFIAEDADDFEKGRDQKLKVATLLSMAAERAAGAMNVPAKLSGHTFHSSLEHFAARIRETMLRRSADPAQRTTSRSGKILAEHVLRLKDCHHDVPVENIDLHVIERMANYWKARPPAKTHAARKKAKPISVDTVVNHMKALRRFVTFLNRERKTYQWQKPEEVQSVLRVDRKGLLFEEEQADLANGPESFSRDELIILYRHGPDLKRLMILCGLNFGFAESEMNSFRWSEIVEENGTHFVRRIRRKSGVYGEFQVWPETMTALLWWKRQHGSHEYVFVNDSGERMSEHRLYRNWQDLIAAERKYDVNFPPLPPKFLRKTAAQQMIDYTEADEITVGIFQCRGKPVPTDFQADKYYRRRFKRVFEAQVVVREHLKPMFAAAPTDAFTGSGRKRGGSPLEKATIERIRSMKAEGMKVKQIARELGLSRPTIHRHVNTSAASSPAGAEGR